MPLFEFVCSTCHFSFEELCTSREESVVCPECGSTKTEKALSVFAAHCPSETACGMPSAARESCAMAANGSCACSMK